MAAGGLLHRSQRRQRRLAIAGVPCQGIQSKQERDGQRVAAWNRCVLEGLGARRQTLRLRAGVEETALGVGEVAQEYVGEFAAGFEPPPAKVDLVQVQQAFGERSMIVEAAGTAG